ncbi:MAG TPA: helix-turn-helix domain-containing protein [Ilumatobacteraceae bacterium]
MGERKTQPSERHQAPPGRPKRDDVRRRILQAALVEFTRHGYDRTSLDQVAAAAGFSKGAVYSNFSGKEDLFLTLMDQQVRHRLDRIVDTVAHADRRADQLAVAGDVGGTLGSLISADVEWQLLFLEYMTQAVRSATGTRELADRRRKVRSVIAGATLEMLGPDHRIWQRFTPDTLAITVLALTNGIALERLAEPNGVPEDLLGQLLGSLL